MRLKNPAHNAQSNYKFCSLNTFNWDSPHKDFRKNRNVFDRWELRYVGAELSFYNKRFDEEEWHTRVELRAFRMKKDRKQEELCCIAEDLAVGMDENLVVMSRAWGNDEQGKGWEKGEYMWEASLDGIVVGSSRFYIDDAGVVDEGSNPYFDVLSLKLYEGPDEGVAEGGRVYLSRFNVDSTRYVFAEFRFINQMRREWPCEFFFTFYDDTRKLISRIPVFARINADNPGDDVFTFTEGWGAEQPGNWSEDEYTLEVEFQEEVVAVAPFTIARQTTLNTEEGSEKDAGTDGPLSDDSHVDDLVAETLRDLGLGPDEEDARQDGEELEHALEELDGLIGLTSIKQKIREHISYLDFLRVRKEMGIEEEEEILLHSVFTGNPGTGKTTVVKLLGRIYKAMGLLSKGHVHVVDSSDLVSGFVRQTGKTTADEIEKARGGILFIDEAYMLFRKGSENDFGSEAIAELITEMSDGKGDLAVMVAGYPAETMEMIGSNPGLQSRFRHYFHFDDYTPQELLQIAGYAAEKKKVVISPEALKVLEVELIRAYRDRDRTFGNARLVNNIIDEAKINMGVRVMRRIREEKADTGLVTTLHPEDIRDIFNARSRTYVDIPPDEELLARTLDELDRLTGLENIKTEIRNMIRLVRYYREINKDVRRAFPLHSVFTGNPGTGKTTLARIMGNLFKALGILERGHLIESDAGDLVAGYLGQTAMKTKERINQAMGGVLFIDEAYSLMDGEHPDFGKKAIETLLKQMDDRRGEFAVIVAGYPAPMQRFIDSNPGLRSRFDHTFVFHDFSRDELRTIALGMLQSADLTPDPEALAYLDEYLGYLYENRNQYFGNARSVRKIIDRAVFNQNLRMSAMTPEARTRDVMQTVTIEDLKDFEIITTAPPRQAVGFKWGQKH